MYRPLEGVKVVDLTLAGSGPSCTKLLCECGAEVIWVESLKGTSTRSVHKFDFYCTGKKAVSINLKTPEGRRMIEALLRDANVFVSNYRPKGLRNLGLTYEDVKKINPGIVYATLTGFGEEGEQADDAGYDPVAFWAKGGMLQDIAEKGSLCVPPVAMGDITTGVSLFGGICAALYRQQATGEGTHVFNSLLGQAMYMNHDAVIETQYGEPYPKTRLEPRRAMLNTYRCSDGKWITITITDQFDKYFNPLLRVLGREDLIGDPRWQCLEDTMYEHAPELVRIFDEGFAKMTQAEAVEALRAIDMPVSVVQGTADALHDPQVHANKYVYKLKATVPPGQESASFGSQPQASAGGKADGAAPASSSEYAAADRSEADAGSAANSAYGAAEEEIYVPSAPFKYDTVDWNSLPGRPKGPRIGENTVEILQRCGFTEEEIAEMLEKGIARQA